MHGKLGCATVQYNAPLSGGKGPIISLGIVDTIPDIYVPCRREFVDVVSLDLVPSL